MRPFRSARLTSWIPAALMLAAAGSAFAHVRISTDLTWSEDIRPIFEKKCMSCHSPGGLAPDFIDLTTYGGKPGKTGARDWAKAIEEELLTFRMPPWPADPRFMHYANERSLTKEEINTIIAWVGGGAPQGPRRDLPAPPQFAPGAVRDWILGPPDFEAAMPEEAVIPAGTRDGEARFEVKVPEDFGADALGKPRKEQWIAAFEFLPGTPSVVHTLRAFVHDPPGFQGETVKLEVQKPYDPLAPEDEAEEFREKPLPPGVRFLGQWSRGDAPVLFPDEAGFKLRPGSTIVVEAVYRKQGLEEAGVEFKDRSRLGIHYAKEEVDLFVETRKLEAPSFMVPAGAADFEVRFAETLTETVHLQSAAPRMGWLGCSFELKAVYPDGKADILLSIPNYRRKWDAQYVFGEPVKAPAGTRLEVTARFDNTPGNRDNPARPPRDAASGPGVHDEKLEIWLTYHLDDHLQIETPPPPPVEVAQGSGMLTEEDIRAGRTPVLFDITPEEDQSRRRRGRGMSPLALDNLGGIFQPAEDGESSPGIETVQADPDLVAGAPPAGEAKPAAPAGGEIHWCPMRGPRTEDCGFKDYPGPGKCEKCEMDLKPKSWFLERLDRSRAASKTGEWILKSEALEPVYWCPNRGREGHSLKDYPAAGACEVCGERLRHKAEFVQPKTHMCMNATCKAYQTVYYSSGLCPECLQPVESMGHMDHTPVHGGQLIMAGNLYHHVEATLPAKDELRIYFYDDWKKPLDPRNFAGKVVLERFDEATEEITVSEIELVRAGEDEFLSAKIPPVEEFPADLGAKVWLAGKEELFNFAFEELSKEPPAGAAKGALRPHAHGARVPPVIPEKAADVVREILRRDEILRNNIAAGLWFDLHVPAFDAMDLAEALKGKQEGLAARQRGRLLEAIGRITQGAILLDRHGDAADAARVGKAHEVFAEGIRGLKALYPEAAK